MGVGNNNSKEENNKIREISNRKISRTRIAKHARIAGKSFAVFAVAILLMSSFTAMAQNQVTGFVTVTELPYELNNIEGTTAVFYLKCLNKITNISVRIWGMSENSQLYMLGEKIGTIWNNTQNLFIITAPPNATLSFTHADGSSIRIEKINRFTVTSLFDFGIFRMIGAGTALVCAACSFMWAFAKTVRISKGAALGWKKLGVALALVSLAIAFITPRYQTGIPLLVADIVACGVAVVGIICWYKAAHNPAEIMLSRLTPLTSLLMGVLVVTGAVGTWVIVGSHYDNGYYANGG